MICPKKEGVTLLETMLVLAVAAAIVIMSLRYYRIASDEWQANAFLKQLQSITATIDSLSINNNNSYSNLTEAKIKAVLSKDKLELPWGGVIKFNVKGDAPDLDLVLTIPKLICLRIIPALQQAKRYRHTGGAIINDDSCTQFAAGAGLAICNSIRSPTQVAC